MTAYECLATLKGLRENDDKEYAHAEADAALTDFLESLGYTDIVSAYRWIGKDYA